MTICDELRASVLQAAIQGKLVKQIPEEGTGEELYRHIQEEKKKLIEAGKIKKEKPLSEISDDEKPFDIPKSWKWCHLQDIVNIRSAVRVHQSDWRNEGVPFYRAREIVKLSKEGRVENELFIDKELYEKFASASGVPSEGDLMVSGVGTLGASYIVSANDQFYYKDASVLCFENWFNIVPKFLKMLLDTPHLQSQIYAQEAYGTTVATLTMDRAYRFTIPLVPINEQKRIVARVDELMEKIDELQKIEKELEELKKAFPGDMKAALLQAAMQGKLTDQREEDGTGEELYRQIQEEKKKLVTEGKIKKEKTLPEIADAEKLFDIPKNWRWCRLGEIGYFVRGNGIKKDETRSEGKPCVRYGQMYTQFHKSFSKTVSFVDDNVFEKCVKIKKGDLVMALTGENNFDIALAAAYTGEELVAIGGDMTKYCHSIEPAYLVTVINSEHGISQKRDMAHGNIIVHISTDSLANITVPLPPLAEQKRIVEKLDRLLPLVDGLAEDKLEECYGKA